MAIIYTKKTNDLSWTYIEMLDSDKPESVTYIPIDESNLDYQTYLLSLEVKPKK
jgi:hypothetical protein